MLPYQSSGHYEFLQERAEQFSAGQSDAVKARIFGNKLRYRDYGSPAVAAPLPPKPKTVPAKPVALPPPPMPQFPNPFERPDKIVRVMPTALETLPRAQAIHILCIVASIWDASVSEMIGTSRLHRIGSARMAAYWLIRERLNFSLPLIGRLIGRRDHTTVLVALRRAQVRYASNADWRSKFDAARTRMEEGAGS